MTPTYDDPDLEARVLAGRERLAEADRLERSAIHMRHKDARDALMSLSLHTPDERLLDWLADYIDAHPKESGAQVRAALEAGIDGWREQAYAEERAAREAVDLLDAWGPPSHLEREDGRPAYVTRRRPESRTVHVFRYPEEVPLCGSTAGHRPYEYHKMNYTQTYGPSVCHECSAKWDAALEAEDRA